MELQIIPMQTTKFYTKREEKANWISHFIGILIGMAGTIVLIIRAINHHNNYAVLAFAIFGSATANNTEANEITGAILNITDVVLLITKSFFNNFTKS